MATLSITNPTLADVAKSLDPDGNIAPVVEILNEENEVMDDLSFIEGNLPTGHRTTIRNGIPLPSFRKLYGGTLPSKTERSQVDENTAMIEAYSEIDKALADLNGNTDAYRLSEDKGIIQGFSHKVANSVFYADEATTPEGFTGLAPRYNSLSAENADNIIDAGGTGSDNNSIWLVSWSPETTQMIYPKGSMVGLHVNNKGQVTIEDVDGSGGRMEAYRTHFRWDLGLCVRDWRYNVRICNIDKSLLTKDASAGADLIDLMTQAIELLPTQQKGRMAFYVPRTIRSFLRRQIVAKVAGSTLSMETIAGRKVVTFDDIPVRRVDALSADEARIT